MPGRRGGTLVLITAVSVWVGLAFTSPHAKDHNAGWVRRSNAYTQPILEILGKYNPEAEGLSTDRFSTTSWQIWSYWMSYLR
jgi:hypothetical protein